MGRWPAVGEIQIRAVVPEGYEDSGSLINALARVARWAGGVEECCGRVLAV